MRETTKVVPWSSTFGIVDPKLATLLNSLAHEATAETSVVAADKPSRMQGVLRSVPGAADTQPKCKQFTTKAATMKRAGGI